MARKVAGETSATATTPKNSEITLDYIRCGNIGVSTVHELIDISGLNEKEMRGKVSALFHSIRNTPATADMDARCTAAFLVSGRPILSLMQKAGDYEGKVFTLTRYNEDGTKRSTRKYPYIRTRAVILESLGFDVKIPEDEDAEPEDDGKGSGTGATLHDYSGYGSGFDELD